MQDGIIMIQARRCKRCGRLLTSKEAVERGIRLPVRDEGPERESGEAADTRTEKHI